MSNQQSGKNLLYVLPIVTTPGDRLFIGLLGSAYIHLTWRGLTNFSLWWALGISLVFLIVIMRWE
jgi:predicted small integral membrane protein